MRSRSTRLVEARDGGPQLCWTAMLAVQRVAGANHQQCRQQLMFAKQ